ncbi:hypothetical protein HI914_00510 [Erysiphe necator]|uniref:Putative upf0220 domain protein n=1 Tax=Uncinula necator TaxID=52586 RepID=A0A0B1P586_UNCNE|nr:hypothetical protein HI914_00510 [Erysiphe necator]KHJ33448.1 putative upf0220 domain protein [Erysiphe necator]
MSERQQIGSNTSNNQEIGVRRSLFHKQLSRRPTIKRGISTCLENQKADEKSIVDNSEIVIRDDNGEIQIGIVATSSSPMPSFGDEDVEQHEAREEEKDRQRLVDAIKNLQRNRNREPGEPAELLEAVKVNLKAKVAALAEDNWLYTAEDEVRAR